MSKTGDWFIEVNRDLEENQTPYTMRNLGKPRYQNPDYVAAKKKWRPTIIECPDPESCDEFHNETGHHYSCECDDCMFEYWMLKH